eukprot:TRINITY_DN5221_c0_g1_i1.p1 TRINITY_DN5221_c0_g1~~TRINITY_DN5221_c0_g1_i1.p1  ORF type:complete len:215 (+),score=34.77 TRINITY_DN5221_c0_g1_i1:36-680(+)
MAYWMRLKLHLLPCISQEVDAVIREYLGLVEQLKGGQKDAYDKLLILQLSIKARIDEFDQFFEENFTDYRIAYFEKQKLRLRKLLNTQIESAYLDDEDESIPVKRPETANEQGKFSRTPERRNSPMRSANVRTQNRSTTPIEAKGASRRPETQQQNQTSTSRVQKTPVSPIRQSSTKQAQGPAGGARDKTPSTKPSSTAKSSGGPQLVQPAKKR